MHDSEVTLVATQDGGADVKARVQRALKRMGVYHRLKASAAYDLYWLIADGDLVRARRAEQDFYRGLLKGFRPGDVVFDIGANQGVKTEVFLKLGARVIAVEPDELNQQILVEKFCAFRLRPKPVTVLGVAVAEASGVTTMFVDRPGSAKNTLSEKWADTLRHDGKRFQETLSFGIRRQVRTLTLDDLIKTYGRPVFVKIDVEGFEANVLRGLNTAVPCLSFEVNLPEFCAEGVECIRLLGQLSSGGSFNYAVDCGKGVVLGEWVQGAEIAQILQSCRDRSVEVFWRSHPC